MKPIQNFVEVQLRLAKWIMDKAGFTTSDKDNNNFLYTFIHGTAASSSNFICQTSLGYHTNTIQHVKIAHEKSITQFEIKDGVSIPTIKT